jgi:hypothetical protein
MGNPRFKFTLSHSVAGTKVISEPDGWKDCTLKLERHPEFHSLVEYFEGGALGGFVFYGSNGVKDGGRDFIYNIDRTYGYNAKITLTVDISFDDGLSYARVFAGVLDLGKKSEKPDNKIMVPVIPDSTWTNFIARMDTPVNLSGSVDIDGNTVAGLTASTINLPSQKLRGKFLRNTEYNDANAGLFSTGYGTGTTTYLIWDNSYHDLDEIDERFEYSSQVSQEDPTTVSKYLFKAKYAGTYRIQTTIYYNILFNSSVDVTSLQFFLKYRNPGDAATTDFAIGSPDSGTGVTSITTGIFAGNNIDQTITLQAGAEVYLYGVLVLSASRDVTYFPDFDSNSGAPFEPIYTSLEVTADTDFPASTAEGYTVYDALKGVLVRLGLGDNPLVSDHFTVATGCAGKFVLLKGLQIRGYTLSEKPFFISFKELWDGLNPIFNLGLGLERSGGADVIRIEKKQDFYLQTSVSHSFPEVRPVREYDENRIIKKGVFGFSQWQSENISGIDDPQTKHEYGFPSTHTGETFTVLSKFIAASYAFETLRRVEKEKKSKDHKFDNDTFILNVIGTSSPFTAETGETFTTTTNLLNESSRYNRMLTPKRNMLRWANYSLIGHQKHLSGSIIFLSGEGNFDMTTDLDCGDGRACLGIICDSIAENGNVSLSTYGPGIGYIHLVDTFDYETALAWENYLNISNNKKAAIRISQTTTNYKKLFIDKLEFKVSRGAVSVKAWAAEPFDLVVTESIQPPSVVCDPQESAPTPEPECEANISMTIEGISSDSSDPEWLVNLDGGTPEETYSLDLLIPDELIENSINTTDCELLTSISKVGDGGSVTSALIEYKVNGVTVHTENLPSGVNGIISYTFTDLEDGDVLRIEITEG